MPDTSVIQAISSALRAEYAGAYNVSWGQPKSLAGGQIPSPPASICPTNPKVQQGPTVHMQNQAGAPIS